MRSICLEALLFSPTWMAIEVLRYSTVAGVPVEFILHHILELAAQLRAFCSTDGASGGGLYIRLVLQFRTWASDVR